jgi:hypothetical protein
MGRIGSMETTGEVRHIDIGHDLVVIPDAIDTKSLSKIAVEPDHGAPLFKIILTVRFLNRSGVASYASAFSTVTFTSW